MAKRRMTEKELTALLDQHIYQSLGYIGGELSQDRRLAMRHYMGEAFGNEVQGRSQVVTRDVQDTIEWMLPSLLEPFIAGERAVQFTPVSQEDVEKAEQETDYINHVFLKDNNGVMVLYSWFKDALLAKNGIVKAYAEQWQETNQDVYEGLTEFQLVELIEDKEIEILALDEAPMDVGNGQIMPGFNVTVKRTKQHKKIRVEPVPPEEFLISRRTVNIETAEFVGHRVRKTRSELLLMGYDKKIVADLPGNSEEDFNEERQQRFSLDEEYPAGLDNPAHEATEQVWITECYVRVDYDGDGIAELRKVVVGGAGNAIVLENEAWPHRKAPFYSLTPVPITHKFFGMSIADLVMDIQHIRSTLLRQLLDAQYLANNPRHSVVEGEVNLSDMLTVRPGGVVRIQRPEVAPQPIMTLPPDQTTYNLLEFITGERESRTGITKYGQGLDANTLNDTASGINQIMTAAQQRVKLIARLFAETGITDLFKGIHELTRKYQDVSRTIRLRNRWIEIDPTEWQERTDLTVEVGLGTGNKEMQLMHLDGIGQTMLTLVQVQGGIQGPLIQSRHLYNYVTKRAELAGFKTPDLFASDPEDPQNQPPPQEPQPDPKVLQIQADMEKAKADLQFKTQEAQAKLEAERQAAQEKIQLEYEKLAEDRRQAEADIAFKYTQLAATEQANDKEILSKHIERAQTEAHKTGRDIELERMRGENRKAATEGALQEGAISRTKKVKVERDGKGRITGATVVEGPENETAS